MKLISIQDKCRLLDSSTDLTALGNDLNKTTNRLNWIAYDEHLSAVGDAGRTKI